MSGSPAAVAGRLRAMGQASSLLTRDRLATKIDMSPAAVRARLLTQARLRDACLAWAEIGRSLRPPPR